MKDTLAMVAGGLGILAMLWTAASKWGAHEQQVMDQAREIQRLEQIISVINPDAAMTFGINRKEE